LIFSSGFEALVGSSALSAIKTFLDKAAKSVVTTYYLSDHLGSNIATVDQTGTIIERSRFAPYGERWGESTERGPGYTGHFEDATGYNYMKARYYGGVVGRFVSPDPLGVDSTGGAPPRCRNPTRERPIRAQPGACATTAYSPDCRKGRLKFLYLARATLVKVYGTSTPTGLRRIHVQRWTKPRCGLDNPPPLPKTPSFHSVNLG